MKAQATIMKNALRHRPIRPVTNTLYEAYDMKTTQIRLAINRLPLQYIPANTIRNIPRIAESIMLCVFGIDA
jgi:hypothetical protein